ncbi:MAG: M15 family metallopeptidase, partial [Clostridia bacterium]|nr:M15 family metallopeptidase [Clostridia bacterium]
DMFDAARKDGLGLTVRSGYRTKESQQQVFDDKVAEFRMEGRSGHKAKQLAKEWVALPGHSEHELGLAVDINADEKVCSKEDLYLWLSQNAIDYGFVCRYPSEKASITHVEHEPGHYRYVGKEHAKAMKEKGLCLEEYVETLSEKT